VDGLLELDEIDAGAGGKAHGLARLAALGLPVPPAVVLPVAAYARWCETEELPGDALTSAFERIGPPLAVRSSALGSISPLLTEVLEQLHNPLNKMLAER
jgi:phosphoenolpyruvate synthase/pyruvate phosphate dikinase